MYNRNNIKGGVYMNVVLIPGDGIGKEIAKSVMEVSDALQCDITWDVFEAGAEYYEKYGEFFAPGLLEAIQKNGIALKGPTATPIGKGFRSLNVQLRQHFNTYANIRPIHSIVGVPTPFTNVDLVIFRENSEDLYTGIEYQYKEGIMHGIKVISKEASERIIREAFIYAQENNRKKVTCVHKANIMKQTDGLFLDVFQEIAQEYPDIESDACIIDALCMKLVQQPQMFDVLVAPNLYGDIISDLCAGLVGGLGFAPSVNRGKEVSIYEAVHGSAPDIAGKDLANPTALLMAFEMLLNENGKRDKAQQLHDAVFDVIKEGKIVTKDIGGSATTSAFTKTIIERIQHEMH